MFQAQLVVKEEVTETAPVVVKKVSETAPVVVKKVTETAPLVVKEVQYQPTEVQAKVRICKRLVLWENETEASMRG